MTLITPTSQPTYWLVKEIGITGITNLQAATGFANTLTPIHAEGEQAFLAALEADGTIIYPALPARGENLEQGEIYDYGGTLLMVRQSHIRTDHDPATVPALFLVYRPEGGTLDWVAGEQVGLGTQRIYNGDTYTCIQAHVTQANWEPPNVPALWSLVVPPSGNWQPGVAYDVNDIVDYQGVDYRCIQAHTSLVGWEPPNVPALWALAAPPTADWQPGVSYSVGDRVLYNNIEYECIQAHTSLIGWEPPNVPALWGVV